MKKLYILSLLFTSFSFACTAEKKCAVAVSKVTDACYKTSEFFYTNIEKPLALWCTKPAAKKFEEIPQEKRKITTKDFHESRAYGCACCTHRSCECATASAACCCVTHPICGLPCLAGSCMCAMWAYESATDGPKDYEADNAAIASARKDD